MSSILNSASESSWEVSAELFILEIILDISQTSSLYIKNTCRTALLVAFLKDTDGRSLAQE